MTRSAAWCLCAVLFAGGAWARPIPPPPQGEQYLFDDYGLIRGADEAAIAALQAEALRQYNSPIVVVTVSSLADFDERTVEALATRWFNTWQVGTLGLERGANQGMLLLVAVQDRRARIELGADWGHAWDDHAKGIMDKTIVPRFKTGDYSGGVAAGVKELHAMAKLGHRSAPPGDFLDKRVRPMTKYSVLDPLPFVVMMGLGFVLTVLGIYPRFNKWLFFTGVGLMVFAAVSYVVLAIVAIALGGGRRRGGGGWSGSGGGFSGGSSGGGGASGSW